MFHDLRSSTSRHLALLLLGLLVAMCVVIVLVLLSDEAAPSHGVAHAEFDQTMQQGGPGAERHARVRWLGLALGLLEVAFFVSCLLLGVRQLQGRIGLFACFGVLFAIAFTLMVVFDHFYAEGSARQIVGGFPLPTALMVYGVGGAPLAFIVIYVFWFDRWILTPDDLEKFEQLVRERRRREADDESAVGSNRQPAADNGTRNTGN